MRRREPHIHAERPEMYQQQSTFATSSLWMLHQASSQLPIHESRDRTAKKHHGGNSSLWNLLPCLILAVLPWIANKRPQWHLLSVKEELGTMINDQRRLFRVLDKITGPLRDLGQESERLEQENDTMFRVLQENGATADLENEQYAQIEQVEDAMLQRIDDLEKHIQETSAKAVVAAYGVGPHHVEVVVKNRAGVSSKFVIALALVSEMPHAIHHFLQMVELKLWDGMMLVHGINKDSVTATNVSPGHREFELQRFLDANLTHMAFTEFSSETNPPPNQHKYSVAFAGRPGGPEFYVNMEENSQLHDHESVFGVVSEGREVIDKFFSLKAKKMSRNRVDILTIESIRLSS
jgi:cyclophilin family peptidyl-prolyl cis-trans isomerase